MRRVTWSLRTVLVLLLAGMLVLAACSPEEEESDDPPADADDDGDEMDDEGDEEDDAEDDGDDDQTWELRFANFLGPDAAQIQAMQWWADEVAERTDGRVTVEFFHGGALLEATDTLPGIGDGRAEMGHVAHFYHPAELPLSRLSEVPFLTTNSEVQARAWNAMFENNADLQAEWEAMGVHMLHVNPSGVIIVGSEEPIASPDDLAGVQIRAVGGAAEALSARDANPIAMPAPEIYESIQRGVIEAYSSFPWEVITAFQLQEVAPYVADPGLGNYLITAAPISLDMWESMPADIQQILTDVSAELFEGPIWDIYADVDGAVCDAMMEVDGEVTIFDEADVTAWQEDLGDVLIESWMEELPDGVDGQAFLDEYLGYVDEFAQGDVAPTGPVSCAARQ